MRLCMKVRNDEYNQYVCKRYAGGAQSIAPAQAGDLSPGDKIVFRFQADRIIRPEIEFSVSGGGELPADPDKKCQTANNQERNLPGKTVWQVFSKPGICPDRGDARDQPQQGDNLRE